MFIRCTIHYMLIIRGGCAGVDCVANLDSELPLREQALAAVDWDVRRNNECFGWKHKRAAVLSVHYQKNGFWYFARTADDGALVWPNH